MFNTTDIWTKAYEWAAPGQSSFLRSVWARFIRLAVRVGHKVQPDPIVRVRIGSRELLMPWSHNLPSILAVYPNYESEIGRLAAHLNARDGCLSMIDVGANIGDTVACLPPVSRARFLCIEASPHYFSLLQRNCQQDVRVVSEFALLTDSPNSDAKKISEAGGTAHVETATVPTAGLPMKTLDEIVARRAEFLQANFLKVDTDGYDLKVLRGAPGLLRNARPVIHIEASPRHWREFGNSTLAEGFQYLAGLGYQTVLIYDNLGHFICRDNVARSAFMPVLNDYALRNHCIYFNLVVFHSSHADAEMFCSQEARTSLSSTL